VLYRTAVELYRRWWLAPVPGTSATRLAAELCTVAADAHSLFFTVLFVTIII
jgi:hypothetical protein